MLSIVLETVFWGTFLFGLKRKCDKIAEGRPYEEVIEEYANKEAEKIKRRNTELV